MKSDLLLKTKQVLSANQTSIDLDIGLQVQGRHHDMVNLDDLGHLCGMLGATAGLAAWICFVAGEEYLPQEGVTWEEAAAELLDLSEQDSQELFAPIPTPPAGLDRKAFHFRTAICRINNVLRSHASPSVEDIRELRTIVHKAQDLLRQAEKLAEGLHFCCELQGQDAEAHLADSSVFLSRASLCLREELNRASAQKRSA